MEECTTKLCLNCDKPMIKRENQSPKEFAEQMFCCRTCAAQMRPNRHKRHPNSKFTDWIRKDAKHQGTIPAYKG